ncbi:thiamine pyrophosphate-dependent dehydrogenase E1 component subunit alpha [Candidatus Gottesmanbacteria bacterium]|nr:thiamine pyrophosphate-dependent dehydrogenase E1 component subunit alpha [Candidatus Gottesmanbacteria bacterium]
MTENILNLYKSLLKIRLVEEKIASSYSNQKIRCPVHLCIGQEAIAVGVCANLKREDIVFSYHRSHGHYLAKGGNLQKMISELYGNIDGCSLGRGGSQHLVDLSVNFLGSTPIVAGTVPVAVGSALAIKMKREKRIVVSFFGDAATDEGVTYESLNFASLHKLPILFVCENNFYSIFTHIKDRQPEKKLYLIAKMQKIYARQFFGNDAEEVSRIAHGTVDRIRKGYGPAFLEFTTYRMKEHCGPLDEPAGDESTVLSWRNKDPLKILKKRIINNKLQTERDLTELDNEMKKTVENIFRLAESDENGGEEISSKQVYA